MSDTRVPPLTEHGFQHIIAGMGPFEQAPMLAVAVSGGSDSLALVFLADAWVRASGGRVIGLTVDHLLREGSSVEAEQVQGWLKAAGIEHHILRWEGEKPASNIQAGARAARYDLLTGWCRDNNILHLLLAHHKDDQAETFMLRLSRGSGVDGLAAMAAVTGFKGIRLLRPLLGYQKIQLQAYLEAKNQPWIEDPSNDNPHYTRSHIRAFLAAPFDNTVIAPALLVERLAANAQHMGRARASLEKTVAVAMVAMVEIYSEAYGSIKMSLFDTLPEEEALRLLSALLTTLGGQHCKPRFVALTRLYTALTAEMPFKGCSLWGCSLVLKKDRLFIFREAACATDIRALTPGETVQWDNRFNVCSRREGLKVTALGKEGWLAIKEGYRNISLPKNTIITLPSFKSLETIIAVPHINFYSTPEMKEQLYAYFAPVTPLTGAGFRTYHKAQINE